MKEISVQLAKRSYQIKIGNNLLINLGRELEAFNLSQKCLVVTNPLVFKLYGSQVQSSLQRAGFKTTIVLVDDGEQAKSLEWAARLYDAALRAELDRNSPIVALGGGVVGDLAGFVAATYMRGVPFIQVPTTLLAQVDSSVGGKVAINHPQGKNLIGAFHQPKLVLTDLNTLKSLPPRELRSGLAEVIKYGVIWDKDFFVYLESNIKEALNLNDAVLEFLIAKSCAIKAAIVEKDEQEKALRAILNFGHTFGHVYEALTNYNTYRHGEAVAMGMVEVTKFAYSRGLVTREFLTELKNVLTLAGLPLEPSSSFSSDKILDLMKHDKKNKKGKLQLILPLDFGKVVSQAVDLTEMKKYLQG